jgi:sphinganine-1-phosphate aldolase
VRHRLLVAAGLGTEAGALPERMAPVNALLAVAPPQLRERLTTEFYSRLQVPVAPAEVGWRDAAPTLRS